MNKEDIIDVFDGDLFFHAKAKIKLLIQQSQLSHFFIIVLSQNLNQEYHAFFKELNYERYQIISNDKVDELQELPWIIRFGLFVRKSETLNNELSLLSYLYKNRNKRILLHGNLFTSMIIILLNIYSFKSLVWICWGSILRNPNSGTLKKYIITKLFKRLYRKIDRIICLMSEDVQELKTIYKCKNVFLCPYPDRELKVSLPQSFTHRGALVGNSGHLFNSYICFAQKIRQFNDMHFTFMLNYGPIRAEKLEKSLTPFIERTNFEIWDEVVEYEEYLRILNEHDIYICPYEFQTGLGAIYSMIKLEKTVCLTGYNLLWARQLGFHILSLEDFIDNVNSNKNSVLPSWELRENKERYLDLFSANRRIGMLDRILSSELSSLNRSDILAYL